MKEAMRKLCKAVDAMGFHEKLLKLPGVLEAGVRIATSPHARAAEVRLDAWVAGYRHLSVLVVVPEIDIEQGVGAIDRLEAALRQLAANVAESQQVPV